MGLAWSRSDGMTRVKFSIVDDPCDYLMDWDETENIWQVFCKEYWGTSWDRDPFCAIAAEALLKEFGMPKGYISKEDVEKLSPNRLQRMREKKSDTDRWEREDKFG